MIGLDNLKFKNTFNSRQNKYRPSPKVTKLVYSKHCVLGRPPFQHTVANGIVYASYIFSIAQQWQEAGYIAALEALFFTAFLTIPPTRRRPSLRSIIAL